jgi:hypothetical protein
MNSLQDLNNGVDQIEFTDPRPANVVFDRTTATNQTVTHNEGTSHVLPVGIEILEIINYQTTNANYTVDVREVAGTTVTWATIPTGLTLTNTTPGLYVISGIKTPEQWQIIRNPTVTPPSNYYGTFYYYNTIYYQNGTQGKTWNVAATVVDITLFTLPVNKTYATGATSLAVTGYPTVVDPGNPGATYTITITPDKPLILSSVALGGTGGTSSFNATTKVITITGTLTQVNSRLANISITTSANNSWDWYLTYAITSSLGENDTVVQYWTNTDVSYLSLTRANGAYYGINTTIGVINGPQITDLANIGVYNLEIKPYNTAAVASFSLDNIDTGYEYQTKFQTSNYTTEVLNDRTTFFNRVGMSDNAEWAVLARSSIYSTTTDPNYWTGRVYFVKRNSANQYIESSIKTTPVSGEQTGKAAFMSSDGTTSIVVGSNPYLSIYYYKRTGDTWTYTSNPISWTSGGYTDISVSKDGNNIAVGSGREYISANNQGVVRIYKRSSDSSWPLETTLTLPGGNVTNKRFGWRVELSSDGNTLAVSTQAQELPAASNTTNNVYIYTRTGTTWTLHTTLTKTYTNQSLATFGSVLKLSDNGQMLTVSAYDGNSNRYLYVYKLVSNVWTEYRTYGGTAGGSGDEPFNEFASTVDLSSDGTYMAVDRVTVTNKTTFSNVTTRYLDIYNLTTNSIVKSFVIDPNQYQGLMNVKLSATGKFVVTEAWITVGIVSPTSSVTTMLCYGNCETTVDNTNKIVTIRGNRNQISSLLDNGSIPLRLTTGVAYNLPFDLLYKVTTPSSATQSRNQRYIFS